MASKTGELVVVAGMLIVAGLLVGMVGYHVFEGLDWIDSFANAAMILGGMGPFGPLQYTAGKLFAGFYALFSGLVFIALIAVLLSPLLHLFAGLQTASVRNRRF